MVDINNFSFPLCGIDMKASNSPRFGKSFIKYPSLIQHSPHPMRVRHIKSLMGNSICVVDTEEWNRNDNYKLLFPPNNYNDVRIRHSSKRFNYLSDLDQHISVTARPNLDTVFSLKHFTGLQNTSFRTKSNFNMKRIKDLEGWENQLNDLTVVIMEPFYKDKPETCKRPLTTEIRTSIQSPVKRMYSSSGRLLPPIKNQRPLTSPNKKSSSRLSTARSVSSEVASNEFEMNLQIFHILGGILQTTDNEVIKTWLLTATEREKALIVDIVRSALLDKQELNIFVNDSVPEEENQIIYTPNKSYSPKLPVIPETTDSEKTDCLIVNTDPSPKSEMAKTRPPTSSTFRPTNKCQTSRPPTTGESKWIPSESFVVN